jgi:hypothetical protein
MTLLVNNDPLMRFSDVYIQDERSSGRRVENHLSMLFGWSSDMAIPAGVDGKSSAV